jgi:hypothetical protein
VVDRAAAAVAFYGAAFGARMLHQVREDIIAQLAVGDAAFWVSSGGAEAPRFGPRPTSPYGDFQLEIYLAGTRV